jgi:hypothetical protein
MNSFGLNAFRGNKSTSRRHRRTHRSIAMSRFGALCLCAPLVHAQLTDATCGDEGDRVCTPSDAPYSANNTRNAGGMSCDYGLLPMPNPNSPLQMICVNTVRRRLANIMDTADPRGFVIKEQEQAIGADVPINLVNTIGTHNSYSNYTEGYHEDYHILHFDLTTLSFTTVDDPYSADQNYSIYDQLSSGARTIRIDPYFYSGQLRVCHGPLYCNNTSDGRLFVYEIREVADWLRDHPGEFVIIGLQDNQVTSAQQYLEDAPIQKYLARYLYAPSDGQPHYLGDGGATVWPSLRQLRAKGKQAMIFSSRNQAYAWSNGQFWTNDTSAKNLKPNDNLSFGEACLDDNGNDSRRRNILGWNNVGEDRSGSTAQFFARSSYPFVGAENAFGIMDSPHTNMAAKCGASVIDLDFWFAQDHAFHFSLPILGESVNLVDFRGPANETRPIDASWSYTLNDAPVGPATLVENQQTWSSAPASFPFRYACAAQRETPDVFNGLYDWEVTPNAGPWSGGEAACQALGAQYHFWFPQTVYEQSNLLRAELLHGQMLNSAVWLNYRSASASKQLIAMPSQLAVSTVAGQMPTSQSITISGGIGGVLRIQSAGPYTVTQQVVDGWPTNQLLLTPTPGAFNRIGSLPETIVVQEVNPETGALSNATTIKVNVNVTDGLIANVSQISLAPGNEQVIEVTGANGTSEHIPFTLAGAPSWLIAEQSSNQTPAQVKVYASTLSPGIYVGALHLVPGGAEAGSAATTVVVQYTVK